MYIINSLPTRLGKNILITMTFEIQKTFRTTICAKKALNNEDSGKKQA